MFIKILNKTDAQKYWEIRLEMLKLHPEAFATSYEQAVKRENPIQQVENNFATQGSFTFGAFDNDELVGVVTLLQDAHLKFRHKANILAMYVREGVRKSGVGRKLLTAAIEKAKSIDEIEQLKLMVVSNNETAKRLYKSLGFKVYGTEKNALKINNTYYDEDHMVLFLK